GRREAYREEARATFTTNALPSLRGWLAAHDLGVKRGLGLDPGESDEARASAQQRLREILRERAGQYLDGGDSNELFATVAFLAQTPSRLVVIALADVLAALEQINIPGTIDQRPNWRRKLPGTLGELGGNASLRRAGDVFAQQGRGFR